MSRSGVIAIGPYHLVKMALAMRKFSLVVKWVEGVVEGFETGDTIITTAKRKHLFRSSTEVVQLAVNQLVGGSIPSCGAISKSLRAKCLTSSQTIMVIPTFA
jgi:hypothetical protein